MTSPKPGETNYDGDRRTRVAQEVRQLKETLRQSAGNLFRQSAEQAGRAGGESLVAGILDLIEPAVESIESLGSAAGAALEEYVRNVRERRPDMTVQDIYDDLVDEGILDADDLPGRR